MPHVEDKSLGDQNTFEGGAKPDLEAKSLGDEATFSGGSGDTSSRSLGDEMTFGGGGGSDDDLYDDGMEIIDLEARYTVEGVLGKGGMGEVLLATDGRLERKVAIKRMLGNAARNKTAVNRFLTEAKSNAALNHPNIVQIYDYGRAKDGPFLIMEHVEGQSLLERCNEGAIPVEKAINLTCQLCDGLEKAHAANIIHRDIKPANVLLTEDNIPKLTDFGLAKDEAADTGMTMAGAVLGSLDFMPPEQRRDATLVDARSDLWSLAATLYQMVTGEAPRVIDMDAVPQQLRATLSQALKTKKDDRYQTAAELRAGLLGTLKGLPVSASPGGALDSGECPTCHSQNELSRKFCGGCGASLRMSCLGCNEEISVWEKFCPECGGNQADLLREKRERELTFVNSIGMELKFLPAGKFTMGSASGDSDEPPHEVTLTKPFYLGLYEVTQEQYEKVMGANPSFFKSAQQPVESVSWNDAVEFCRKLSALPEEKAAGRVYRLPSEAEWEYACRAGTATEYSFGDDASMLGEYAWFGDNSGKQQIDALNIYRADEDKYLERLLANECRPHPVGQKQTNPWGFYDMHGNVWEWCQDMYYDYPSGVVTDPMGPNFGSNRVSRGGSWYDYAVGCRSAYRRGSGPSIRLGISGLRVACVPSSQ